MVSHNRMASISLSFAYSFATSMIVFLIRPTYSSSNRKEVFNFQKPGPLGFALFARWIDIKEWSVLYPGNTCMSALVRAVLKLELVKKKSKRQCMSGFLLLQVNILASGLKQRQMSMRSNTFEMCLTSFNELPLF